MLPVKGYYRMDEQKNAMREIVYHNLLLCSFVYYSVSLTIVTYMYMLNDVRC